MASTVALRTVFLETRDSSSAADLPHDNLGPNLNIAIWILTGAAIIFLCLRLYCKLSIRRGLWWDDYVLIAASVALVAQTAMLSVCVHYGFGKHTWDIADWPTYLFVSNVTGVCSITAAAWSKTSFAITLLRFSQHWKRRFVWFCIITVNLFLGLSALFTYVQCTPIKKLWDSTVPGHCWNSHVIITYNSFSSTWSGVMDLCLAILPWTIIRRLSLNRKERLGVLIAMSMGVFAGLTSIAKTATLGAISNPDAIATIALMILATAEISLSIIAASIPSLRVLIRNTMQVHSIPHFYRYHRTETPSRVSQVPSGLSSDRGHLAIPSPARKGSNFSDFTKFSSPLNSPDSALKRNWPGTTAASVLYSDFELQHRETTAYEIASVHKR
ncbi:hypothetical protein CONLIGDRAFT_441448 [Coniochaeta ligniaria NRRL 30616]|uniref:Rhodopsin domain-containing protein n=1 Tax=Coniochaeta ligniaria NRRL 30616 TaxID=1408157 RepID=A0A1J7IIW3_9PEZI|nr:hypothetical protein CONLIGDRAFT_441448 [Coniochaeta ligniaria NRRL 30616]